MPAIPNTSDAGKRLPRVPTAWRNAVATVLISEKNLRNRITELSKEITRDYLNADLVIVSLLRGSLFFTADLIRQIPLPMELDFLGVSSYRNGTNPGLLTITKELELNITGRDLLLIDDILDTGQTLSFVHQKLNELHPKSLKSCVLLDKPARRSHPVTSDYTGFVIPNQFVVGYGMDYKERFRNLPFIGVLRSELFPS